jgi:hypothetical protein
MKVSTLSALKEPVFRHGPIFRQDEGILSYASRMPKAFAAWLDQD